MFGGKNGIINFNSLRALTGTRCSNSLAHKKWANQLKNTKSKSHSVGSGAFKTNEEADASFAVPEFSYSIIINWKFDITDSKDLVHEISIGKYTMKTLVIS